MKKLVVLGIVLVLLFFGLILLVFGIGSYNSLVKKSANVDQQWAQVQTVYQRRADLIPNLVNTVQGAANFEKSTLTEITQARASVGQVKVDPSAAPTDPAKLAQFEQAQNQLGGALSRLLVVAENYPNLKSNTNFLGLQSELEGTENRISVERGRFNDVVRDYNVAVKSFPGSIFASMFGFAAKPYFAATPGAENAPTVRFDFNTRPAPQTAPAPR